MAKIKKVTCTFDAADLADFVNFRVYYRQEAYTEDTEGVPYIEIPVVPGKTAYDVVFPTAIPVTMEEGQWQLGVTAVDDAGNETDMDVINPFFDFIPGQKPVWRR